MKRIPRLYWNILRIVVAVALLVYLGSSGAIDWSAMLGLLEAWPLTLCAILIVLLVVVATAARLSVLLRPRGLRLSLSDSIRLTMMSTFFNTYLPGSTGGELLRIYYASAGNSGRRTEVITILLLDRVTGMFAMISWPLLAFLFFPKLIRANPVLTGLMWAAAGTIVIMTLGLLIGSAESVRTSRFFTWVFLKLPFGNHAERMMETAHVVGRDPWSLMGAVALSLAAHTLSIVILLILAYAIDPVGFSWEMSVLFPLGFLVNTLPLTPGGLGVGEAALDQLFGMVGLTGGAEVLLGWRLIMIIVGLGGLATYLQGRQQYVHQSSPT